MKMAQFPKYWKELSAQSSFPLQIIRIVEFSLKENEVIFFSLGNGKNCFLKEDTHIRAEVQVVYAHINHSSEYVCKCVKWIQNFSKSIY